MQQLTIVSTRQKKQSLQVNSEMLDLEWPPRGVTMPLIRRPTAPGTMPFSGVKRTAAFGFGKAELPVGRSAPVRQPLSNHTSHRVPMEPRGGRHALLVMPQPTSCVGTARGTFTHGLGQFPRIFVLHLHTVWVYSPHIAPNAYTMLCRPGMGP